MIKTRATQSRNKKKATARHAKMTGKSARKPALASPKRKKVIAKTRAPLPKPELMPPEPQVAVLEFVETEIYRESDLEEFGS